MNVGVLLCDEVYDEKQGDFLSILLLFCVKTPLFFEEVVRFFMDFSSNVR